jgi:hypothetical protein
MAHQAAGEPLCGWCSYAEQAHRIAAEGNPARLAPPPEAVQLPGAAAMRLAVLRREVAAFDRAHRGWHWRCGQARPGLRSAS